MADSGGLAKEAVRWLFGGGALAMATFLGTTAYQQGQLQIERERYLRDFLDRYVELATKGSLDERIRFVLYWESLNVADRIGVDLTTYKGALRAEFQEAETFAAASLSAAPRRGGGGGGDGVSGALVVPVVPGVPTLPGVSGVSGDPGVSGPPGPVTAEPPVIGPPDKGLALPSAATSQQEAYFASRSKTIATLIPGGKEAPVLERQGFEALLANNIPLAKERFAAAEEAWPEYHNVAELNRLMGQLEKTLGAGEVGLAPEKWRETLALVLQDYSWGMPQDLKRRKEGVLQN